MKIESMGFAKHSNFLLLSVAYLLPEHLEVSGRPRLKQIYSDILFYFIIIIKMGLQVTVNVI
jgi:hypothetical protein